MIGDVNLFLNDADELTVAEIEVIRSQMQCKHMQLVRRKEKTTPFGVNLLRSQVLFRAAQAAGPYPFKSIKAASLVQLCSQDRIKSGLRLCTDHDCCKSQPA